MFREAKVCLALFTFGECVVSFGAARNYRRPKLVLDESDRARSKRTKRIHKAHKQKHKASGGYVNDKLSFYCCWSPSHHYSGGFCFYMPILRYGMG